MDDLHAPDFASPLLGYRAWGVARAGEELLLQSAAAGFVSSMPLWAPLERFEAQCLSLDRCGSAPSPGHGCGIYVLKEEESAMRWARAISRHRPVVLGHAWCWGRVVESERGWRARYAYPACLTQVIVRGRRVRLDPEEVLASLAGVYGVPRASASVPAALRPR